MDRDDLLLSHQLDTVLALAESFSKIEVITSRAASGELPGNIKVHNVDWDSDHRYRSSLRFLLMFVKALTIFRPKIVFSHMTDVQASMMGPILRALSIRHVLWYAHKSKSVYLLFANIFVDQIVTSTPGSCPIISSKVMVIGQGIDSTKFFPRKHSVQDLHKIVHIGRLDPSKRTDYIIEIVKNLRARDLEISLSLIGSIGTGKSMAWAKELQNYAAKKETREWLHIMPGVRRSELPELLSKYDIFIHGYLGSLDKTLLEATFMKIPVVTENPEYLRIFGSWSGKLVPNLENEFNALKHLSNREIAKILEERYQLAYSEHSLIIWISRLVEVLTTVRK
jgi:glycosyltransferase involved in cell wall biosynthesis